jgi:hypothetical protein
MTDENCFNGQHCEEGMCVPDEDEVSGSEDGGAVTNNAPFNIEFLTPESQSTAYTWDTLSFTGTLTVNEGDAEGIVVSLSSSIDGSIASSLDASTGAVTAETQLSEGNHTLTLKAQRNDEIATAVIHMTLCGYQLDEDFTEEPDADIWRRFDSAVYVEDGWIDMTNNQISTWGQFFNVAQQTQPGDLDLSFRIYTGPLDAGADGFSMTIIDTPTVDSLEKILQCFTGLGNHFSPGRQTCEMTVEELAAVQTFSIEFDTYANGFACAASVNPPVDPTCEDHVAITRNGSAMPFYWYPADWGDYEACGTPQGAWNSYDYRAANGCKYGLECINDLCLPKYPWWDREVLGYGTPSENTPRFWSALDNIEDSQWHDVHIVIDGTNTRVTFDEVEVINATVPAFEFKGGFLGFTGGSGAIGNYHRFDDLKLKGRCLYTGPMD